MAVLHEKKLINLALQGGGSHGAYTWGVLDRLLEEDNLTIEGISGTSAGALNGAFLVHGFNQSGSIGAKRSLDLFWSRIGALGSFEIPEFFSTQSSLPFGFPSLETLQDSWGRMFSPYQTNPLNFNPLRSIVEELLEIDYLKNSDAIPLFISCTQVETGRVHIFKKKDLSHDVLMASASLPFTFQAVMIDGHPYWDGGYVGNPSLFPLIYNCSCPDIVIVQVNPFLRQGVPATPGDIINRVNEITFNAALQNELRAIAFVQRLIEENHLKDPSVSALKSMNMHMVGDEEKMRSLQSASKFWIQPDFLNQLKGWGRDSADLWLRNSWADIGVKSSLNIRQQFLD